MAKKTFIVTHAKARAPLTIKGNTLEEALAHEGLNPDIWKEIGVAPESEVKEAGENSGDARNEDN